ncbi:MAG: AAA family ATPase, partial [Acidimicrobiia bacterium]|nr:AAA family ATPase [Acidimicrobiia bacterium]
PRGRAGPGRGAGRGASAARGCAERGGDGSPSGMKVIALYSPKGGVGKTSAAVNLAHRAALERRRVLLWDLDPQAAASFYLKVTPRLGDGPRLLVRGGGAVTRHILGTDHEYLDVLPADVGLRTLDLALDRAKGSRRRLARVADVLTGEYDLVVVDCAPSLGLVSENVFRAADLLLVPVIPAPLSVRTLDQLDELLAGRELDVLTRCFFTLVDGRRRLHQELMEQVLSERDDVLRTVIPEDPQVELMGEERAPVADFAPGSPAAAAYAELWVELQASLR